MSKKARPNITVEDIEGYYLSPEGTLYQLNSFVPEPQATMVAVGLETPEISRELSYFKGWVRLIPDRSFVIRSSIPLLQREGLGKLIEPDDKPKRHRRTKAEIQAAQDQSVASIVNEGDDFQHLRIKTPTEDDALYHISVATGNTGAIAEGTTLREAIMKLIPDVESIPTEFTARERDVVKSILKSS